MNTGFKSQCVPSYRILTPDQIEHFHFATLEILETVGVKVLHPEAVELMCDAGCRMKEDNIVLVPNWLVEKCIRSAPNQITIFNRLGQKAMHLAGNRVHFGLGTDLVQTYDVRTGKLRQSRLQDVADAAKISDYFDEIDFIASYALPFDSPANLMCIDSFKTELENSVKPIFFTAAGQEDLSFIHEMATAVTGGEKAFREKPNIIHYSEPLSPLVHTSGAIKKLFFCADNGVPVCYAPGMMSGASAPVTLAGAIIQGNAEALSGVVLHQLRAKGAPIISGFGMSTMDMKTSACVYGCPEYRMALSACADLYHYYGIPMWGTAGASDSNCLDQQAAMEWAMSLLIDGLNGANLIHDVAYLGQGLVGHPAGIVMCSEIISYVKHFINGFKMDAVHMAKDVIREVGPAGDFLSTDHTMKFFKQAHWQSMFCNRDTPETWAMKGSPNWGEVSTQKAIEILDFHKPESLSDTVRQELVEIRTSAESALGDKNFET
ncbi:MAG: trimethylamine methyltransferase family protein [Desulfobacterales bacterium]